MAKDNNEAPEAQEAKEVKSEKGKLNSKELKVMAEDHFKRLKVDVLYGCSDGQFFYNINDARQHAKLKKLEVSTHNKK